MKIIGVILIFLSCLIYSNGLKILAILPFGSKSHFAIGHSIVNSLADVGHEMTVISPYPQKKAIKNKKYISTEEFIGEFFKGKPSVSNQVEILIN